MSVKVYEYENYRVFLKDWIESQPRKGRGLVAEIARHLKVHSSLMSQVFQGKKDITAEHAFQLIGFLKLTEIEADFFLLLVNYARAGSIPLQKHLLKKIKSMQKQSFAVKSYMNYDLELSEEDRKHFYSKWYFSAIRNLTSIPDHQTFEAIQKYVKLPQSTVEDALQFLVSRKLCVFENGKYNRGPTSTFIDRHSPEVFNHHTNWRFKAIERYSWFTDDELSFTAPMALSKKHFKEFKKDLLKLIEKLSKTVNESDAEQLACFNLDWFFVNPK